MAPVTQKDFNGLRNMGQRVRLGDVMEIYLDGWYYYAQQLPYGITRFIDFRSQNRVKDFLSVNYDNSMFDVAIYNEVLASGVWKVVARNIPIPLNIPKFQYIHFEDIYPDKWELYNLETGEISISSMEACKGLERCAVWPQWKIEERIRNRFHSQSI